MNTVVTVFIVVAGVVLVVGALIFVISMGRAAHSADIAHLEAFRKMMEAENSTWKYSTSEPTITSGSPVTRK